jgi:hypothetical protein
VPTRFLQHKGKKRGASLINQYGGIICEKARHYSNQKRRGFLASFRAGTRRTAMQKLLDLYFITKRSKPA